jgi:hypothetical protein
VFQLELVRSITFWCLFIVSAFLSVNLYVGTVDGIYNQGFMVVVAIVLEGVKILCLTMANTNRWQATQHKLSYMKESMLGFFSRAKRKNIKDPELLKAVLNYEKKNRVATRLYAVYVFTAFLSVAASFGFVRTTVEHKIAHSLTTNNTDTISIYKDSMSQFDSQIKENETTIAQTSKSIDQYNKLIAGLDPNSDTFQRDRSTYQANINNYQRIVTQFQQKNSDLMDKKLALNSKIQDMSVEDIQKTKNSDKTMYQLMGDTLGISDKIIMFILLYMLAFVIEIGLFICSPHFNKMDDEGKPSGLSYKSVKQEEKIHEEESRQETKSEQSPIPEMTPEKGEDRGSGHEQENQGTEEEVKPIYPELIKIEEVEKEEYVSDSDLVFEPEPATTVVEVEAPADIVRTTKPPVDKYIEALFNNGDKTYLKDKYVAAQEAGMSKLDAMNLFDFLTRTKVNGFPMIQFRSDTQLWHTNFTSEFIKTYLKKSYFPPKKKE